MVKGINLTKLLERVLKGDLISSKELIRYIRYTQALEKMCKELLPAVQIRKERDEDTKRSSIKNR